MIYEPITSHGFSKIMTMNILFIYAIVHSILIKIVKPCSEMQILSIVKCYGPSPFINQYEMPVISQETCKPLNTSRKVSFFTIVSNRRHSQYRHSRPCR